MDNYDISHKRGDTWQGLTISYLISSVPVDLTDSIITMQVKKKSCDTTSVLEFTTVDNTITITDAISGLFTINSVIIDIYPRIYYYDLQVTLSDETVRTILGGTFEVLQDVTR